MSNKCKYDILLNGGNIMGKVISLPCAVKETKNEEAPAKRARLGQAAVYNYESNLRMCEKLFLVKPGEYPSVDELYGMKTGEARSYIHRLNTIFMEKAEERHLKLTGKTIMQAAKDKMDEWLKSML
jgi:hypothetical protein